MLTTCEVSNIYPKCSKCSKSSIGSFLVAATKGLMRVISKNCPKNKRTVSSTISSLLYNVAICYNYCRYVKGDRCMTYHLNVRLPDHTEKQIKVLLERTGMTMTQLVIVALDRLYHTEEEK